MDNTPKEFNTFPLGTVVKPDPATTSQEELLDHRLLVVKQMKDISYAGLNLSSFVVRDPASHHDPLSKVRLFVPVPAMLNIRNMSIWDKEQYKGETKKLFIPKKSSWTCSGDFSKGEILLPIWFGMEEKPGLDDAYIVTEWRYNGEVKQRMVNLTTYEILLSNDSNRHLNQYACWIPSSGEINIYD